MLTDDDLTTELRGAFRADTDHLAYQGRRRPRRTTSLAVPLAAGTLVVGAVAVGAVLKGGSPAPPTASPAPASSATATPTGPAPVSPSSDSSHLVTQELQLAGFTLYVKHRADQQVTVRANFRDEVPPGLRMVTLPSPPGRAWVGKDPVSGDNAVFVRVPTSGGGHHVFAILSAGLTPARLVDLVAGPPRAIPLTKD